MYSYIKIGLGPIVLDEKFIEHIMFNETSHLLTNHTVDTLYEGICINADIKIDISEDKNDSNKLYKRIDVKLPNSSSNLWVSTNILERESFIYMDDEIYYSNNNVTGTLIRGIMYKKVSVNNKTINLIGYFGDVHPVLYDTKNYRIIGSRVDGFMINKYRHYVVDEYKKFRGNINNRNSDK